LGKTRGSKPVVLANTMGYVSEQVTVKLHAYKFITTRVFVNNKIVVVYEANFLTLTPERK